MAIADGFEVWLSNVDGGLAEKHPGKTTRDLDPLLLFKAYENGTPPSVFSADPDAPLVEPKGWRQRIFRPRTATRSPHWYLVGLIVVLISASAAIDYGFWGGDRYYQNTVTRLDDIGRQERLHPSGAKVQASIRTEYWKQYDEMDTALNRMIMFTLIPLFLIRYVALAMFVGAWSRYLRLNYKVDHAIGTTLMRIFGRLSSKSPPALFPNN